MSPPTPPPRTKNKKNFKKQVQRLNKFHWKNIITQKKNQAQRNFRDFIAGADVVFIAVLQTSSQNPKTQRKPTHKIPKAWKPQKMSGLKMSPQNKTKKTKKNREA